MKALLLAALLVACRTHSARPAPIPAITEADRAAFDRELSHAHLVMRPPQTELERSFAEVAGVPK
jgi:hypothetical protein